MIEERETDEDESEAEIGIGEEIPCENLPWIRKSRSQTRWGDKYSDPVPKGESCTNEYNNPEAHHIESVIPRNFKEASVPPHKEK
ncbi:hypothetical protein TNIN_187921 [Trichonephila inaurata madagascariensis]|uniref:Uncharacterized protein n=1 Tax=Trichonephila inaurata madagascariensis TaxID=2747483 RepID=A0A8X6XI41_9ARAC|nr:hypothetical protein TNIN_187921 [Trichonephila inaurata madagascariensis]